MEEKEISLVSLLLYPFYHWKSILCGFLAFLILGTVLAFIPRKNDEGEDLNKIEYEQKLQDYYNEKNTLEGRIEFLRSKISDEQFYMNQSVLMNVDPLNAYRGVIKIHISTDYQILPSMVYQSPDQTPMIVSSFCSLLNDSSFMDSIAEKLGLENWQADELIDAYEDSGNTICITVISITEDQARQIIQTILEAFPTMHKSLHETYGDFEVSMLQNSITKQKLPWLSDNKNSRISSLLEDQKVYSDTQKAMKELSKPSNTRALKIIVLFSFMGVFLAYAFYCVKFLTCGKLYRAKDLRQFDSLVDLGSVLPSRKYDKIQQKLHKIEDRASEDLDASYSLIAENLRIYSRDAAKLVVTGDCDPALCQKVTDALQAKLPEKQLSFQDSLLRSAAGVASLGSCDGVILVEKCMSSKLDHIQQEITKIQDSQKPVVGCVVVDI